ncbi:MAG: hypothetical protein KJ072_27075 [Verrucomicrobia bacterium]|nr:hypothetical protein [Verrucomicrobiota bacterium]
MTQIQNKHTGLGCWAVTLLSLLLLTVQLSAKPLKVFILAGQSNMEGPAQLATFDYLGDDPATAPLLEQMRGEDGQPRVCDHVWISYLTGAHEENFELTGKLTAGYGSMWGLDPTKPGGKIGPEFTFGLTLEAALWKRGASNAGYHYLGCAKTFALMGRAFALAAIRSSAEIQPGEMAGYIRISLEPRQGAADRD